MNFYDMLWMQGKINVGSPVDLIKVPVFQVIKLASEHCL